VAEFVEDDEMFELLRKLGTDYVQGFGIGRPFALAPHFPSSNDAVMAEVFANQQAG
jgi:EAL domain-containing protein (putative c-di-GMP-specific phosphodiesterase class I)